ncbi:putative short-chain oxidoreductase [Hysterangium stoloniferum]|nr:putative short-chain oxidoreductase [Hysterangium stoloniferum]
MTIVWVITGCSSGFGKDVCLSALQRGHKVIATCRGNAEERLADLVAQGARALSLDVTASKEDIETFAHEAIEAYGHVDIICNNAGYVQFGTFEELSPEEVLKQYQTLVFGPLNITRAFLPHLRERKTGVVAMIGSQGAHLTFPGIGSYTSAKAALLSLSRTLAAEVQPFGIEVTCIEPGSFHTDLLITFSQVPVVPLNKIPDYEETLASFTPPEQPGDPKKGAERIVDLLTHSGYASGKPMPFGIALGDDAYNSISNAVDTRKVLLQEWKDWSLGTGF